MDNIWSFHVPKYAITLTLSVSKSEKKKQSENEGKQANTMPPFQSGCGCFFDPCLVSAFPPLSGGEREQLPFVYTSNFFVCCP